MGCRKKLRMRSCSRSHRLRFMGFPNHTPPASLDCLRQRVFEVSLSRRFHCRDSQQSTDGFYQPFTLVKDAQRHGLTVRPVDVTRSDWLCTIEEEVQRGKGEGGRGRKKVQSPKSKVQSRKTRRFRADPIFSTTSKDRHWTLDIGLGQTSPRLGLRYVKGLSEQSGKAIMRERMKRAFAGIDDLQHRVPELRKDEMRKLAAWGVELHTK